MAETPFPVEDQVLLDNQNDGQYRVCADTRALTKVTTISTVIGQREYALPVDVIRLIGVAAGNTIYQPITSDQALRFISGLQDISSDPRFYLLGSNLGFQPVPSAVATVTLYYQARPTAMSALGTYEVGGDYARLVDRRANCNLFDDDGQLGLAAAEEAFYQQEASRLLRKSRRAGRSRLPVVGYDGSV